MSVKNITWAWTTELPPIQKLVLLALADHSNDQDNTCWPSFTHLEKKTGLSRPTVSKAIQELTKCLALEKVGNKHQATLYKLNVGGKLDLPVKQLYQLNSFTDTGKGDLPPQLSSFTEVVKELNPNHKNRHLTISEPLVPTKSRAKRAVTRSVKETPTKLTWEKYSSAYQHRYGVQPVRNATVNGQLAHLVGRLGADEAPKVAEFYLQHNGAFYVKAKHPVNLLLRDCEGIRTEWATGHVITDTEAKQIDRKQNNFGIAERLIAENKLKREAQ